METSAHDAARMRAIPVNRDKRRETQSMLKGPKALAKMGMAGSIGALFVSGFFKFQGAKSLHIYSGLGLLAFTVWHHVLNQPKTRPKRPSRMNS